MKDFQALPDYWSKLFSESLPVKGAVGLGVALAALLFPSAAGRTAVVAVLALVFLDTATGTVAARVTGEAISSSKFGRALVKVFGYFSAILAVGLSLRAIPGMATVYEPAISSVTSLMAVTELLSVFENLKRMGFPLPEWVSRALESKREQISGGK